MAFKKSMHTYSVIKLFCLQLHPALPCLSCQNTLPKMDAAKEQRWHKSRLTLLMFFHHYWWLAVPAHENGIKYPPDGFLIQCQLFYESLVEPKPACTGPWSSIRASKTPQSSVACSSGYSRPSGRRKTLIFWGGGWAVTKGWQEGLHSRPCTQEFLPEVNLSSCTQELPPAASWAPAPKNSLQRPTGWPSLLCSLHCQASKMTLSLHFLTPGTRASIHHLASRMMSSPCFLTEGARSLLCPLASRTMLSLCFLFVGMRSLLPLQACHHCTSWLQRCRVKMSRPICWIPDHTRVHSESLIMPESLPIPESRSMSIPGPEFVSMLMPESLHMPSPVPEVPSIVPLPTSESTPMPLPRPKTYGALSSTMSLPGGPGPPVWSLVWCSRSHAFRIMEIFKFIYWKYSWKSLQVSSS